MIASRQAVLATLLMAACSHDAPFKPDDGTPDGPRTPGNPVRLTFNPGQELSPSWLDSATVLYTWEASQVDLLDRCAAAVPAAGGTRRDVLCSRSVGSLDSTESYTWPVVNNQGQIAFVFEQSQPGRLNPDAASLKVGSRGAMDRAATIHPFPFNIQGTKVDGASFLTWLSDSRLVYLAEAVFYISPSKFAPPDTVRQGLAVALVDLSTGSPPVFLSGTDQATSVSAGGRAETIHFTLAGDTRVYSLDLADGSVAVVWDFGASGIVRDVQVRGNRMAATVGGAVALQTDSVLGTIQRDSGGVLWAVDLAAGQAAAVTGLPNHLFRHPSLAADGRVVVRAFPAPQGGPIAKLADLYLFEATP